MRHKEQHSQKNEARWWQLPGILSLPWRGRSGRNYHHREIELNTSLKVLWPTNFLGGLRYQINESYSNWLIVDKCLTFNFWVTFDERSLNYKGFLDRLSTNFFFFWDLSEKKEKILCLKCCPAGKTPHIHEKSQRNQRSDTTHCERAGWKNTALSRSQWDHKICRIPPLVLCEKSKMNYHVAGAHGPLHAVTENCNLSRGFQICRCGGAGFCKYS